MFLCKLSGSHCINPPIPDAQYNLRLNWNEDFPPAHNETVMYVCNAGTTWNRFESDFNKNNFTLTCQENNIFSEEPNVPWPTCLDGDELISL